jgi:chromosome segregation ATPase
VLLAAAAWFGWQAWTQSGRVSELSARNADLQERLEAAERRASAAESALESASPPPVPSPERVEAPPAAAPARPDEAAAVQKLRDSLGEATATIARLETRLVDAEAQAHKLDLEVKRLAGSEASLNEDLSAANRLAEALQRELKGKSDRVAGLEIERQRLLEQVRSGGKKAGEVVRLSEELQEIHRRRENYLAGILRRYRDLTDQYRSLAGTLDERRSDERGIDTADLARLQNSISMAEEDMRQLNSLNAQAQRLQKKLGNP